MTIKIDHTWDDIIEGGSHSLVENRPNARMDTRMDTRMDKCKSKERNDLPYISVFGGYLLITMNYPRTKSFVNKTSTEQKKLYSKLFQTLEGINFLTNNSKYIYEYCQSGHIHLHGYVEMNVETKGSPIGAVADVVKRYLSMLPKKYQTYNDKSMFSEYIRYRCPSICVQYIFKDDVEGLKQWETYMNKFQ